MLVCLCWVTFGACAHKFLSAWLYSTEKKQIFSEISLYSLGTLHRMKKSLDIFNEIKVIHLEDSPLSDFERKASIRFHEAVSTTEMELFAKAIYSSFPENYKKYSLYTNWSEAKKIIREMEKNDLL